jgi:hypothetical protein
MAKRRRSRRRLPWPRLGEPIERLHFEWGEQFAREEQYRRMLKLKAHYGIEDDIEGDGIEGWKALYELLVAVVSEFDDGLKIVDWASKRPS